MGEVEQSLNAVGRFQEAALAKDGFRGALTALCDVFEADCVTLEVVNRATGRLELFENARVDPDSVQEYADYYRLISPRVADGLNPHGNAVRHDLDLLSEEEMDRDPFYNEFLPRYGLRYFLSLKLDPSPEIFAVVAFQFRPAHGIVEPMKLRLAEAMQPLLHRALVHAWLAPNPATGRPRLETEFSERFGLTRAEARLGMALKSGMSIREYSELSGLSRNTVYTHYARLSRGYGYDRNVLRHCR